MNGMYEVSSMGRVKTFWRRGRNSTITHDNADGIILDPALDALGYTHVVLIKDGKRDLRKVHALVAEAFLGYDSSKYNREDSSTLVVNHINGVKWDNRLENLEVVTQLENVRKRVKPSAEALKESITDRYALNIMSRLNNGTARGYLKNVHATLIKAGLWPEATEADYKAKHPKKRNYTFSALEETTGLAIDVMMQITGMDRSKTIAYCIQKCYQDEYAKNEDYIKNLRAIVKMQKNLKGAAEDCDAIKKALQDFVDAHTEEEDLQ